MVAILQIVSVEAIAGSVREEVTDSQDLESLGWSDGVMSSLVGDRRERNDTPGNYADRELGSSELSSQLKTTIDFIVFDAESSANENAAGYADLIRAVVEDSVADPFAADSIGANPLVLESVFACSLWGADSIPCDSP